MSEDGKTTKTGTSDELDEMSSEEIEVRAIEDAIRDEPEPMPEGAGETEQDIEYAERRQLAVDERENADPTRH
jgi:hypothetical protein